MGYSLVSGHPPLMVFTVCLTAFGFTMVVLAYLIGETELPNPDVPMDWNKFFQKVSNLHLCFASNSSRRTNNISNSAERISKFHLNSSRVVDESNSMSAVLSNVVDPVTVNPFDEMTFVEVNVQVQFKVEGQPESAFKLRGSIMGKLLGLTGKYAQILFNLSMTFHPAKSKPCAEDKKDCGLTYNVCISMNFPSSILPKTKVPDGCETSKLSPGEYQPIVFSVPDQDPNPVCLSLEYTPDMKLTEMLSPHDRSVVNLHLMHTSYFMFVMVMTLVCYSLVRGRFFRPPSNYVSLHKVPQEA